MSTRIIYYLSEFYIKKSNRNLKRKLELLIQKKTIIISFRSKFTISLCVGVCLCSTNKITVCVDNHNSYQFPYE